MFSLFYTWWNLELLGEKIHLALKMFFSLLMKAFILGSKFLFKLWSSTGKKFFSRQNLLRYEVLLVEMTVFLRTDNVIRSREKSLVWHRRFIYVATELFLVHLLLTGSEFGTKKSLCEPITVALHT